MTKTPLPEAAAVSPLSLVCLNAKGRFVKPGKDLDEFSDGEEISPEGLPEYLRGRIVVPEGTTDVFVWVHGWQNSHRDALTSARRLFSGINLLYRRQAARYPRLGPFQPAFLVVRWPSKSSFLPRGYREIRDRAAQMTEQGEAEFFLASLLGYLDRRNTRQGGPGSKTLAAAGGFYVHCLGHSFGGRFLTAAVNAAATPQAQTLSLLRRIGRGSHQVLGVTQASRFQFTVDSMLIFQMAAPSSGFALPLTALIRDAPFRGPLMTTFSAHDTANCFWHNTIEKEKAIGCLGVAEPHGAVTTIALAELAYDYGPEDFGKDIVNVDASAYFDESGPITGAHSDFYYEESVHLLLSLVNHVRG